MTESSQEVSREAVGRQTIELSFELFLEPSDDAFNSPLGESSDKRAT